MIWESNGNDQYILKINNYLLMLTLFKGNYWLLRVQIGIDVVYCKEYKPDMQIPMNRSLIDFYKFLEKNIGIMDDVRSKLFEIIIGD